MHYYNHHLGDYAKDTGHLSLAEHGAYRMLLDHYYSTETPLPGNLDALCRLCRATSKAERQAVDAVLAQFFIADGTVYMHRRVESEIFEYRQRAESASRAGKMSGEARRNKGSESNGRSTDVQRTFNGRSISVGVSVEPTNNQEPKVLLEKEPKARASVDFESACSVQLELLTSEPVKAAWLEYQSYRQRRHKIGSVAKGRLEWTEAAAKRAAKAVETARLKLADQQVVDHILVAIDKNWKGFFFDDVGKDMPTRQNKFGPPSEAERKEAIRKEAERISKHSPSLKVVPESERVTENDLEELKKRFA